MTCNACGEKPRSTAKDFTKAVIEINNPETLVLLRKVVIPASMGTEEQVPPAIGKYHNVILYYEANKHVYLYSSDGIPTLLEMGIPQELIDRIDTLEEDVDALNDAIDDVEQEIEDLKNSPDVVDIVATYADLQAYDTSDLGDKDVIRVLADETHDDESSYYRWNAATQTWTFIGATGPYYTKDEVDDLLDEKQDVLTFDDTPTAASNNPVKSSGIKEYVDDKIESIDSSARVLSADDYNWPEDNPDGVALWKLPYGAYRTPSDGGVKYYVANNDSGNSYRFFMVYPNMPSGQGSATIFLAGFISGGLNYNKGKIVNILATGYKTSEGYIITSDAVIDNLTTFALGGQAALSAKQGYVLNTRIGDLSTLQTTAKTSTVDAINELASTMPATVQATGTSTTDVMSQNAVSSMVFADPGDDKKIKVGSLADVNQNVYSSVAIGCVSVTGNNGVALGPSNNTMYSAKTAYNGIAIGSGTNASGASNQIAIGGSAHNGSGAGSMAIGTDSAATGENSVALGMHAVATRKGELNVGTGNDPSGYNDTVYRLVSGVYDPQAAHDAATKGYVDTAIAAAGGANTINSTDWSALWQ